MVKEIAWTPTSFENQLIKVIKISAMLTLLFIFVVLINSTHQYNQNPDYNAAHPRFTKIDDNNYLNILNNRSGFVLPHNSKIFPKGSRILPLFLISQSLSKQKELERNKSNESHTSINTSTQINNETPLIRNPENSMIDREKIMKSGEVHDENKNIKTGIQGNEYRGAGEQSSTTSNEDVLEMTTEKLVNSKIVLKNDETNDCHDDNDVGPTLDFRINVPVHLRIAKDRNGNGFNLKSIDLGQSKKKMKNDDHDQNLFGENSDQDWFRDYSESERTEKNIVEKAVKHTDKPFSLVKFVSNLFHSDPNSRKKSSMDDYEDDEDLIVEQELFGKNGLFDAEETTSRKTRIGGSFWINHDPDYNMNSQHAGDKFASKNSRNTEETPIERGETAGEESFESARVIMPLWGETRMPKDGSGLWNANGLTVQNGQQILEGLDDSKFPQKASLIEFQPFFGSIIDDGNENYFPPRGVLSFM